MAVSSCNVLAEFKSAMKWHHDALAFGPHWPNLQAYLRACDDTYKYLSQLNGDASFTPDVPTVVCVARNEQDRIAAFISHHQALGAARIHIIDNASQDNTAEIAASFTNTTVWCTDDSYARAAFGQMWVAAIVRRHGLDRWVLNLDADELFVYDGMDTVSLGDIQLYLSGQALGRLYTPLIDLYSHDIRRGKLPLDGTGQLFFDGQTGLGSVSSYRLEETAFGPHLSGGPRGRMMAAIGKSASPWLSKFALSLWDAETAYPNVHFPYPYDRNTSETFGALLHLKLFADLERRTGTAIAEAEHFDAAAEYHSYREWLAAGSDTLIDTKHTVEYAGPQSVIEAGLIQPAPWSIRS